MIDKNNINSKIINIEKSADARITSVKFTINETRLHILNLYAPSGTKFHKEMESMFKDQILYYLRNNLSNTILCGDFNCITNKNDKSRNGSCPLSKTLSYTLGNLNLKDIWTTLNNEIEFTFFRENYGSRIDRIYAADLKDNFTKIWVRPVSFSDHSCVFSEIKVNGNISMGKFYWKLNVKLLEEDNIEVEFKNLWENLIRLKKMYSTL